MAQPRSQILAESNLVTVELAVQSVWGAQVAQQVGASRIELCSALALGGITPSSGLVASVREVVPHLPVHVLLRPREGNFSYSAAEKALILRELAQLRELGVSGFVVGALTPDGELDFPFLKELRTATTGVELTLHRAVDFTPDLNQSVATAVALGMDRILTSGGAPNAHLGHKHIQDLVLNYGSQIEIMAGGGITAQTVRAVLATGVTSVHASAKEVRSDTGFAGAASLIPLGTQQAELTWLETDAVAAAQLCQTIAQVAAEQTQHLTEYVQDPAAGIRRCDDLP